MKAQSASDGGPNARHRGREASRRPDGHTALSASKAIVRLDTRSIRNKAIQAHRRAERALEKLKTDLKRYHEQDVPGFRAWMHRSFGDLLTRQRECQQSIAEKVVFIGEVKEMVERYGLSYPEAYRKVMWRRAHPEDAEAEDRAQEETQRQRAQARPADRPDNDTDWDDEFDDDDDFSDDEIDQWLEEMLDQARKPRDSGASHADQKTAKELYRNIVRRLHPDHHGQMSEAHAALWHEAQEAYRRQDLSALHSILARCDDGAAALGDHTPVSLIMRMTKQLTEAARSSRNEIRHARQDIAWRYEDRVNELRYTRKIEQDLRNLLNMALLTLGDINRDIAELEREANRQEQRHSRATRKTPHPSPSPHRPLRKDYQDDLPF